MPQTDPKENKYRPGGGRGRAEGSNRGGGRRYSLEVESCAHTFSIHLYVYILARAEPDAEVSAEVPGRADTTQEQTGLHFQCMVDQRHF